MDGGLRFQYVDPKPRKKNMTLLQSQKKMWHLGTYKTATILYQYIRHITLPSSFVAASFPVPEIAYV